MVGNDVQNLQKILNTDPETLVAETGPGSKGNETSYFGEATKRALIKFQEKYRGEILSPIGLFAGTGVFGEKTREKMNALNAVPAQPVVQAPKQVVAVESKNEIPEALVEKGDVMVMFPSRYSGTPGTMINISGAGFTATDNTIYFNDTHAVVSAKSWNGKDITFKIPSIPKGFYRISVKNPRGESNKDQFFIVTDGVTPAPQIESASPTSATRGDTVVIKGSGFTQTGNMLLTGVGLFKDVSSSDGTTLSFIIPMNIPRVTTSPKMQKFSHPIWIHIVNANGVSNEKSFIMEY